MKVFLVCTVSEPFTWLVSMCVMWQIRWFIELCKMQALYNKNKRCHIVSKGDIFANRLKICDNLAFLLSTLPLSEKRAKHLLWKLIQKAKECSYLLKFPWKKVKQWELKSFMFSPSFTSSVIESNDEVASSYRMTGGFFKMALAIATLCFSPPGKENFNRV